MMTASVRELLYCETVDSVNSMAGQVARNIAQI